MGAEDRKLVQDTGAFLLNVTSAVAIIFFNKKLMGIKDYGFNFGAWRRRLLPSIPGKGPNKGAMVFPVPHFAISNSVTLPG